MKVIIGKQPGKSGQKQKVKVRLHEHDTWNMDQTLAYIIGPMLEQLKSTSHAAPHVDPEDVPASLRPKSSCKVTGMDERYFDRWNWVLDEMIFSFNAKTDDTFENQFFTDDGYDSTAQEKHQERVNNGFRLFGKYYESLWD